jgi:hypothetical protein
MPSPSLGLRRNIYRRKEKEENFISSKSNKKRNIIK